MFTTAPTKRIRDYVQKPSQIIRLMIDGLKKQKDRKGFKIDMMLFLSFSHDSDICFGCAATCTLQELCGKDFYVKDMRKLGFGNLDGPSTWWTLSKLSGFDEDDVRRFEAAVDDFRRGTLSALFEFCEVELPTSLRYCYRTQEVYNGIVLPYLQTIGWFDHLPRLEQVVAKLEKDGF